jgi:peptide/nickel transport system permease protein
MFNPAFDVPQEIQGRVRSIKGGRAHFTALLDDGSIASWGDNMFNQTRSPSGYGFTEFFVDYYQNAAVDARGNIVTWGQRGYIMGTDQWGRDVFTRLVYGGRVSLTVGFISVLISGFIGIIIGGLSGYYGGKVDMFLMRFAEVVSSIPFIPLAVILAAIVANRVPETGRIIMIMVILGLLNWPFLARLTRGQILSEKENEFVTAAKAMGIRERVIIFKHILPNVLQVILVNLTLSMATCLLLESTLSFLGFGVIEPTPTWGNMLNKCVDSIVIRNYWWRWVFPASVLGLAVISINIMGDGMRDAIDPKSNDR